MHWGHVEYIRYDRTLLMLLYTHTVALQCATINIVLLHTLIIM